MGDFEPTREEMIDTIMKTLFDETAPEELKRAFEKELENYSK